MSAYVELEKITKVLTDDDLKTEFSSIFSHNKSLEHLNDTST